MPTPEPWSILADVAAHLQVSEDTVLRWIAKRKLPAHRVGRIWRFKLTEVDLWVRAGGERTSEQDPGAPR
jgi:excisionase family DNA binding protein